MTLKACADDVAKQEVICTVTDPAFPSELAREAQKIEADKNGIDIIEEWLSIQGYDTTLNAMSSTELQESTLLMWSGIYPSTIANVTFQIQGEAPPATGVRFGQLDFWSRSTFSPTTPYHGRLPMVTSHSANLVFKTNLKHTLPFTGKFW